MGPDAQIGSSFGRPQGTGDSSSTDTNTNTNTSGTTSAGDTDNGAASMTSGDSAQAQTQTDSSSPVTDGASVTEGSDQPATDGTADLSTLGLSCVNTGDCLAGTVQECCTAPQCRDTCMLPCMDAMDCPDSMGCEHGYCLFACANDDAECAMWPGFTCQHGGQLCESD